VTEASQPASWLPAAVLAQPTRWLVTGAAGFIGSHIVQTLLGLRQHVAGLDNFATGKPGNLEAVRNSVGDEAWSRFRFVEADIRDGEACRLACQGCEIVLHQAALGSVPRSIAMPLATHASNDTGFVNMLVGAREAGVRRFVFASSSSVYGDHPALPKVEDRIGAPLSPYAATKLTNEIYAAVFARTYGLRTIGLRYFNVFGARQDPLGTYAAVIPRWIQALAAGETVQVNGDGLTSRDFCHVTNAVQANLLAATATQPRALDTVYNVACGTQTSLMELLELIRVEVGKLRPAAKVSPVAYGPSREGDVRHSLADVGKARALLGYEPVTSLPAGLALTVASYLG
jgi:UDP-N-acetylglucosamine 4-epimerase